MTEDQVKEIFMKLAAPFPAEDIEWRAGATNGEKTKALALAYITARAVMDRLDEVVGPQNWRDTYHPGPGGGVVCALSLKIDGEWVTKEDGAENTDFEEIKGGLSSAFKRAGVKWGIGRYLYRLESKWEAGEQKGKVFVFTSTPKLPAWALPKGAKQPEKKVVEDKTNGTAVTIPRTSKALAAYALEVYKMNGKDLGKLLADHDVHEFNPEDWEHYIQFLKDYYLGWQEAQAKAEELSTPKAE